MRTALDELLGSGAADGLAGIFGRMEWAEEEITAAQKRHPASADLLWHSFKLLTPTADLMSTELVYRSHCRELLERVAAGEDTRLGTAAEVAIQCSHASQVAPLTTTAAGLYARVWGLAFPGHGTQWDEPREHYESLYGSQIDDLESWTRRKLTQDGRRVTEIDCGGMHHGEAVTCTATVGKPRTPVTVAPAAEPASEDQLALFAAA